MIYISDEPKLSPWGAVQHCEEMNKGIYFVETAGHGGIMIKEEYAKEILSPEARKCGFREKGYLNFEEDCAAAVAQRKFLDKEIWEIPNYVKDKTEYENSLNNSVKRYFPEYWGEREKKLSANTYDKQYIVSDFLIGKPIMVDTKAKTLSFYSYNMYGQLYDLKKPEVHKPNQAWSIDITYIPIKHGFLYLTAVIDWYSRCIVGWDIDDTLDTRMVINALKKAFKVAKPQILNSDQGCQFTSQKYIDFVKENGIRQSMDGKSRWADNIMIERWFRSFKYEEAYLTQYNNIKEARIAIGQYIHTYNFERRHSALDYQTPAECYYPAMLMPYIA